MSLKLPAYLLLGALLIGAGSSAANAVLAQSPGCPTISVTCPDSLDFEKPGTWTANISGLDASIKPVYKWTVFGGTIIEGQGTASVKIKPSSSALTVTVEVEGLESKCSNRAACSIIIESPQPGRLFDSYGDLRFKDEKARLLNFAIELRNQPGSQGYVIAYARRDDSAGSANSRAERAKLYLVNEQGIDGGRIVMVDGGTRKERTVELYITPQGGVPPTPKPDTPDSQD
jgi:hypothetical protein